MFDKLEFNMAETLDEVLDRLGGPALLHSHRRFGEGICVDEYVAKYKEQVERGMGFTRAVYLDTNYWVRLRDAEVGKGTVAATALLGRLRALVSARKIVCVSHLTSVLEISKQLENSARASAALVDELSERVALAPTAELDALEIGNYIRAVTNAGGRSDQSRQWTCIGQIFQSIISGGTVLPASLPDADRQAILKSAVDALWNQGLSEIFEAFKWDTKRFLNADLDADVLTNVEDRKKTRPHNGDLKRTREAEFQNTLNQQTELFKLELVKILGPIGVAFLGAKFPLAVQGLVQRAVTDYQQGKLGTHLPGFAIRNELYAAYECDPKHTILTNDWQDWQHASAALPYCDLFCTEGRLAHQLTKLLKLDTKYQCRVVGHDMELALAALDPL